MTEGPKITQLAFEGDDIHTAQEVAGRLGYGQTAYTSSSALWGLFCLSDEPGHKAGCIIKTKEFGFMFVQDLEDMYMEDLKPDQGKCDHKFIDSTYCVKCGWKP